MVKALQCFETSVNCLSF